MLDPGSDQVFALLLTGKGGTFYGIIIGFAAAAGEDYFIGVTAQQGSDVSAGILDRLSGL